jgi:hypothetical protein
MKLFSNQYSAVILLSPFCLALLAYGYVWAMVYKEKIDGRSRAVEGCKEMYKTNAQGVEVNFQDIVLKSDEYDLGAVYKVTGTAIYKDKDGTLKNVKMGCTIGH